MTYLLDSDCVIDWLNGMAPARERLQTILRDAAHISVITYGEVFEGILGAREREAAARLFQEFLASIPVLPVTREIAHRYAIVSRDLRSRGALIPSNDIFIAATALEHGLTLVTGNRRHFDRVPGLALLDEP